MAGKAGGRRDGAGRKPRGFDVVRLHLRIERAFLDRVDMARRRIEPPKGLTRAAFLRRAVERTVAALEAAPEQALAAPLMEGGRAAFPLELPATLHGRAQRLVDGGRAASLIDLVRAAGVALAAEIR